MNDEVKIVELEAEDEEITSESGKGLGIILIGGVLALGGLAVACVRAYKKKKAQPEAEEATTEEPEANFKVVEDDSEE